MLWDITTRKNFTKRITRNDPDRVIYGSENGDGYNDWLAVRDNEYISGQFLWTAYDYLGEAPPWADEDIRGWNTRYSDV